MPFTTLDLSKQSGTSLPSSIVTASGLTTGKVLQVVQSKTGTGQSSTSTSLVEYTGGNISITPSATSSKVLVMVTGSIMTGRNGQSQTHGQSRTSLYRDSTDIDITSSVGHNYGSVSNGNQWQDHGFAFSNVGLDSPNTTSSVTYKIYFKGDGSLQGYIPFGGKVIFTAMEIAA